MIVLMMTSIGMQLKLLKMVIGVLTKISSFLKLKPKMFDIIGTPLDQFSDVSVLNVATCKVVIVKFCLADCLHSVHWLYPAHRQQLQYSDCIYTTVCIYHCHHSS